MSKNHLTEGTVRAVTALHTRAFSALVRCSMTYAQTARLCLSNWITHLLIAVPPRSRATFIELLCGCLISPEGWVTRAISAITRRRWTTYYKPPD